MDARTKKQAAAERDDDARLIAETIAVKRDRLLASLTLIAGIGAIIAAVRAARRSGVLHAGDGGAGDRDRAGAAARMVRAARRAVAAGVGPVHDLFLLIAIFAVASILIPATDWVAQVPHRITKVRAALEPVFDLYKNLDRFIDRTLSQIVVTQESKPAGRPH